MTGGSEIVARRLVRLLLRNWAAPAEAARAAGAGYDKPFFGIYLPAAPENRQASQGSRIGPDDRCTPGSMIELDTGSARYLIRFTQTLERQTGWTWTLFNAVRKLAPEPPSRSGARARRARRRALTGCWPTAKMSF